MPPAKDVLVLMQDPLPPATEVFTADFFEQLLFAPATFYETASYSGCHDIDEEFEKSLNLSDRDKRNISIHTMLWLAHTLVCDKEATNYVVDRHKPSKHLVRIQSAVSNNTAGDEARIMETNVVFADQSPRSAANPPQGNQPPFLSHGSIHEERPQTEVVQDTHAATPLALHSQAPFFGSQESHGDDVRKSSHFHQ